MIRKPVGYMAYSRNGKEEVMPNSLKECLKYHFAEHAREYMSERIKRGKMNKKMSKK